MNLPKGIKEEIIQKSMKTRAFVLVCDISIVTVKHHENIQNDIHIIVVVVAVVVLLLFYVHGNHLRSCRDGQLT